MFVSPRAFCPAAVTLPSPSGLPAVVSYGTPTSTGGTPPTTVSCSPASGSTFPVGATTVTCTATDQVGRTDACAFSVMVAAPPRLSVTRFLAFGDSITWGEDGRNSVMSLGTLGALRPRVQFPAPDTYPGALQASLAARYTAQSPQVFNAGKQGEAVTDPATFPRFVGFTSSRAYDVVLLMEGANDLGGTDTAAIVAGLGRMVDDAKSRNLKVFLATLPPQNPDGFDPAERGVQYQAVGPFNDQLKSLAVSKDVLLVDVNRAFNGDLTLIGSDGLHPTAAGYHLIADTFLASIRQTLELPAATSSNPARALPLFVSPRPRQTR